MFNWRKPKAKKQEQIELKYKTAPQNKTCACCEGVVKKGKFGWTDGRHWFHDNCNYLEHLERELSENIAAGR